MDHQTLRPYQGGSPGATGYPAYMTVTHTPKAPRFKDLNNAQRAYLVFHYGLVLVCVGIIATFPNNAPWSPFADMHFGVRCLILLAPAVLLWCAFRWVGKRVLPR